MFAQLEKDGLGATLPVGERPPDFDGKGAVKLSIEPRGRGEAPVNFWVRKDIAGEVTNAFDTRGSLHSEAAARIARALNLVQLTGPTDAVFHSANVVAALTNAPHAGNVIANIAAKLPGVNVSRALLKLAQARSRYIENSPEVQAELVKLARIGALRTESRGFISTLDKTARLALNGVFDDLVAAGLAKDSIRARREFINQVGQYNPRLQGILSRLAKELGVSPFIVAGRSFNRQGIRALIGAPGFQTTGPAATAKVWATNLAGVVTGSIVVPAVVNYLTTGRVAGRDGTPVGAIDTGADDANGKHIIVDPLRWSNARRGARITGLNAFLNGLKDGHDGDRIGGEAVRDIVWGAAHPWLGPVPTAVTVAATGSTPSGFREAKQLNPAARFPTASQFRENLAAAFEESYPVFGAAIEGRQSGEGAVAGILRSLGGAAGVRSVRDYSPEQGRAESAEEAEKRSAVDRRDAARLEFEKIRALPPQQRTEPLLRLRERDPQLFERVLDEIEFDGKGFTPAQRVVARLGVKDGARARFIVAELAQRPTAEAKRAYLEAQIKAGLVTDAVADQLGEMLDAAKSTKEE